MCATNESSISQQEVERERERNKKPSDACNIATAAAAPLVDEHLAAATTTYLYQTLR